MYNGKCTLLRKAAFGVPVFFGVHKSISASKNNPTKMGSGNMTNWKEQAKALFFIDKLKITEIAEKTGISRKSISKYIHSLPEFEDEAAIRSKDSEVKRAEYKRNWDKKNRPNRYSVINADTLRREHDMAAAILSKEKYH